jgi:hypothetical protein
MYITGGLDSAWPPVEEYPVKKLVRTTSGKRKFAPTVHMYTKKILDIKV